MGVQKYKKQINHLQAWEGGRALRTSVNITDVDDYTYSDIIQHTNWQH